MTKTIINRIQRTKYLKQQQLAAKISEEHPPSFKIWKWL